ncbi:uncharacterized protein EAE97_010923 [Botrytis byssoidea]|uniref:Uncharacterized protein n=1 Tax=Botrytis byssoidea TaxID=139641 RepID=A0A9P5HXR7_9HELO|nr:uncharacterized protein EAE97_010923 [Botrytis byssoidea]KAF7923485.1 hypothetical protein EAE97_010923 [Botrytis byssoidea]
MNTPLFPARISSLYLHTCPTPCILYLQLLELQRHNNHSDSEKDFAPSNILNFLFNLTPIRRGSNRRQRYKATAQLAATTENALKITNPSAIDASTNTTNPSTDTTDAFNPSPQLIAALDAANNSTQLAAAAAANVTDLLTKAADISTDSNADQEMEVESHWHEGEEMTY